MSPKSCEEAGGLETHEGVLVEFKGGQSVVEPRLVDVACEIQRLSVAK